MAILDLLPESLTPSGGTVTWSHLENTLTLPADRKEWSKLRGSYIGFTQQDVFGAFDPVLSMGTQMLLVIKERSLYQHPSLEQLLRVKLEEVKLHDIDRLWKSYPHQLSGGQLQRCQLAMAMVIQPALLITDEPTSAIDKINQFELLDVFRELKLKYNMAILCITHEERVVRYLADREIQIGEWSRESPKEILEVHTQTGSHISPVLEVTDLMYNHVYGGLRATKGAVIGKFNFKLYKGNCLGIVGESGSGKSTLAQLLVGLLIPRDGNVFLDGETIDYRNAKDLYRLRTKIQLVMQDGRGSLHPYLTIRKTLLEIAAQSRSNEGIFQTDVTSVLEKVELPNHILDRIPGQLSGGECLRVSIARALLMQPEVLICDESTSSLDGMTRDGIIDLLIHLKNHENLAIIFISHDDQVIRRIADQVMVMADGKVVENGLAKEVILNPTHPVSRKIFNVEATFGQKGRLYP